MGLVEVVDLGSMPPANSLAPSPDAVQEAFPLVLDHCRSCGNLQLRHCLSAEVLYKHYFYMTPSSSTLDRHYRWLIDTLLERGFVSASGDVVEIGSNRGALLAAIAPSVGRVLGVDPAENIAAMVKDDGVETICSFFDLEVAERIVRDRGHAQLVVARHCMAHNEWPQNMLEGAHHLLTDDGVLVIENNYAGTMVRESEFDQIYHEHMFYYSLSSLSEMLNRSGFRVIDVEIAPIHGGSIVCFAAPEGSWRVASERVAALASEELESISTTALKRFAERAYAIRKDLCSLMSNLRERGCRVAAYGATAKGATLLNFCGLSSSDIFACADSTLIKQGRYIPGTGIPIVPEQVLMDDPPDYFLLTAWNYKTELMSKARAAGAREVEFIVPIPRVEIVS